MPPKAPTQPTPKPPMPGGIQLMPRITLTGSTPPKPPRPGEIRLMPHITLSGSTPAKPHPIREERN